MPSKDKIILDQPLPNALGHKCALEKIKPDALVAVAAMKICPGDVAACNLNGQSSTAAAKKEGPTTEGPTSTIVDCTKNDEVTDEEKDEEGDRVARELIASKEEAVNALFDLVEKWVAFHLHKTTPAMGMAYRAAGLVLITILAMLVRTHKNNG
ncbi:hypothetical protein SASPL_156402 [Salvia splendens]|uniref:Uncharacterized protein n=1 Tax=Salvia splendens TaxID=180675 RepID=A0A8X8YX79_SALSN|nr:hypothetical protein SASPL_156402 [Salvia splendens]